MRDEIIAYLEGDMGATRESLRQRAVALADPQRDRHWHIAKHAAGHDAVDQEHLSWLQACIDYLRTCTG